MSAGSLRERGAGSILTIGVSAALLTLTVILIAAIGALPAQQRASAAADAAALAAADARSGRVPGEPCELARRLAAAHEAHLSSCELNGMIVTVSARIDLGWTVITGRARGGPAPGD